jgi:hypothetical protein
MNNPATPAPDQPALSRWQWHPQLREEWGSERLYFWRIWFPTYDRGRFLLSIKEVMLRTGVCAYAVYELYGGYDMLLRVWLPTTHGAFESTFKQVFNNDPNIVIESFSVTEIVTHWPWVDGENGEMRRLDTEALSARLPNKEIERINSGLALPQISAYEDQGLVAPSWHSQGIKFAILIGASRHSLSASADDHIRERLAAILNDADPDVFSEKSLYKGMGFAAYLMLGRVQKMDDHHIGEALTQPINQIVAPETFGSRTTTFVTATEDLLAFADEMRVASEAPERKKALDWLREDEGQLFEVKGSAFVELNGWMLGKLEDECPPKSDIPTFSLCKAIVGLLNAEGGTIIVGALEAKRYKKSNRLTEVKPVGEYLIWGVTGDMPGADWDWDLYERKIRDVLAARIDAPPNDYLDFQRDGVSRRPLCVISVRAPTGRRDARRWFYHFPKGKQGSVAHFWVREGNRTKEKLGTDIDSYKSEKNRRVTSED